MSMAAPAEQQSPWVVIENPAGTAMGFQPYGGGLALWKCKDPEVIISGPAETGKTRTALEKLDAMMWKYPGSQAVIVRKTYRSLKDTVLQTYERKVLGAWDPKTKAFNQKLTPVLKIGGERVEAYQYPNGSRISLGGMDEPTRVLSSERDVIYINQAEELTLNDWEILTTRATGRAGNMPYAQMIADCNPGSPTHWIRTRAATGRLHLIESRHEDNPVLFDQATLKITEQGRRSLAVLDALTGVRYRRLRLGQWAAAEGAVYEGFDRAVHLINPFRIPDDWPRFRAIDFGYTNPFVCQWWAADEDWRLFMYREIYMSHLLVEDAAVQINTLSEGERIYGTVADHDAGDRATLDKYGIETIAAMKLVSLGIQAVQARLRKARDGRPRLFILNNALVEMDPLLQEARKPLCTDQEVDGYIWKPTRDGSVNKEEPLKKDDHGMDTMRYLVAMIDEINPPDQKHEEMVTYEEVYEISPY